MPGSSNALEHLKRALLDRIRGFEAVVADQISAAAASGPGMRYSLRLFEEYAGHLRDEVVSSFAAAPNDNVRMAQLGSWNVHLRSRAGFFDERFRRGDSQIPQAIANLIEADVALFGGGSSHAVVTIGSPDNFVTFISDLRARLFEGLTVPPAPAGQPRLVLITVPESEGARLSWLPITCGHELAHYLQRVKPVARSHSNDLDPAKVAALTVLPPSLGANPGSRALEQVAAKWLEELTCDAYAVHRFGAGAVGALTDFLAFVSPGSVASDSHPPRALRTRLMLQWINLAGGDALGITNAISDLATQDTALPGWAVLLEEHFTRIAEAIWTDVSTWCTRAAYGQPENENRISGCADLLESGTPPVHWSDANGNGLYSAADLVNAVWMMFATAPGTPVGRLALKALDILDFLHRWSAVGGKFLPPTTNDEEPPESYGALSAPEIRARLAASGPSRLQLVPRLPPDVTDASVDLRLGNEFIVFARSNIGQFDALDPSQNPRTIQSRVQKPWGDVFYLHPGQLVLAATLEYVVMPPDLVGQVITRSSYGRLGLLSATAVQVHPRFTGCLTLELVNLGEVPMAITPGERVAQLMLWNTHPDAPVTPPESKYRMPTGPEFSKIRSDRDADILRALRGAFASAHSTQTPASPPGP
ncbi:dCTP deaminase [Microbacterium sp. Bi128]|uniref:dCTP deaminase n=1 Tax=Microbacterium sp. Bi128 TaxID=2821115 RepID=UPI001DE11541|nr:dCTP deaminase [Microbacterium sp. Bi128]CAH0137636.1 dCTP deaminase [Microbacterium sp. Bi128]